MFVLLAEPLQAASSNWHAGISSSFGPNVNLVHTFSTSHGARHHLLAHNMFVPVACARGPSMPAQLRALHRPGGENSYHLEQWRWRHMDGKLSGDCDGALDFSWSCA